MKKEDINNTSWFKSFCHDLATQYCSSTSSNPVNHYEENNIYTNDNRFPTEIDNTNSSCPYDKKYSEAYNEFGYYTDDTSYNPDWARVHDPNFNQWPQSGKLYPQDLIIDLICIIKLICEKDTKNRLEKLFRDKNFKLYKEKLKQMIDCPKDDIDCTREILEMFFDLPDTIIEQL